MIRFQTQFGVIIKMSQDMFASQGDKEKDRESYNE